MIAIVYGTCLSCYLLYCAKIDAPTGPEPLCPTCHVPLSSIGPHRGLHIIWKAGEPLSPLRTTILTVMALKQRAIIRDDELPPVMPPPPEGVLHHA
jgi:hypothetical protein